MVIFRLFSLPLMDTVNLWNNLVSLSVMPDFTVFSKLYSLKVKELFEELLLV